MKKTLDVNIVILNYNGEELLADCLPSILCARDRSQYPVRVSVIDNVSTDNSLNVLRESFPEVQVYPMSENRFLLSYNEVLRILNEEIVILLNNDIKVDEGFIDPLIEPFETRPNCFFTTPKTLSYDKKQYQGNLTCIRFKYGFFKTDALFPGYQQKCKSDGYTIMTGFGAFRRKLFLAVGGYESLYFPGRWEDLDICYRAWKLGLHGWYVASSLTYHMGAVAFNKRFGKYGTLVMAQRNHFLFIWKNLSDIVLIINHIFFLIPRLLFALFRGNFSFVHGFFQAIPLFFKALSCRRFHPRHRASDRLVLDVFKDY